jgi:hypothetical protein
MTIVDDVSDCDDFLTDGTNVAAEHARYIVFNPANPRMVQVAAGLKGLGGSFAIATGRYQRVGPWGRMLESSTWFGPSCARAALAS